MASTSAGARTLRRACLAVGVVLVIAAGVLAGVRLLPGHGGSGAAPGSSSTGSASTGGLVATAGGYGVATVAAGCPAAAVGVATARCPAAAECWANLTVISGAATIESAPCGEPHTWETFAIALMPAGARTFDQRTLTANPTVREVCSRAVLLRSRRAGARRLAAGQWLIEVLPPSEAGFYAGARMYRCIAAAPGKQPSSAQFVR